MTDDRNAVQRFRPYQMTPEGGRDGQVRLNPDGMYVRWPDYERVRAALQSLVDKGGLGNDLGSDLSVAREALNTRIDWEPVFHRTSQETRLCSCYGLEGDNAHCPIHGVNANVR